MAAKPDLTQSENFKLVYSADWVCDERQQPKEQVLIYNAENCPHCSSVQ